MKQLILRVRDKSKIGNLKSYCNIVYTSKLMNFIGIEICEENIYKLENDGNVISFRESEEGKYQPSIAI